MYQWDNVKMKRNVRRAGIAAILAIMGLKRDQQGLAAVVDRKTSDIRREAKP